jgi:hypothetical protein
LSSETHPDILLIKKTTLLLGIILINESKLLNSRKRVSFSTLFRPENRFHIENEKIFWDKRFKGGFFRHNRYFGPRGEILFYFAVLFGTTNLIRNNLKREKNIDSLLNDRNVFYTACLPIEMRTISKKHN